MAIRQGSLVNTDGSPATKDGVQDIYKIPDADAPFLSGSEQIRYNGSWIKPVGSFTVGVARNLECIVSGQQVQLGLPPNANDEIGYMVDTA